MPEIEVLETGHLDRRDSAFPTLVRLDNGDIVCGFSVGGGPSAKGDTQCARSSDGGRTWTQQSVILEATADPTTTNHLRLSRTKDGGLLAYGERDYRRMADGKLQTYASDAVFCRSADGGRTWSEPEVIPARVPGPYEIANPIVVTHDDRWLAPAATHHQGRYAETVVLFESADAGRTWPNTYTLFEHADRAVGYLEQKVVQCQPNRLLALAWRQDFENDVDLDNCFSFSNDGGRSWAEPLPTGIQGQTMTPLWLGEDRFLILYNHRFGRQTVQMCLVRASDADWSLEFEGTMYDAQAVLEWNDELSSQQEISRIKFGYPVSLRLDEDTVLAAHWCEEQGHFGVRWTRLKLTL